MRIAPAYIVLTNSEGEFELEVTNLTKYELENIDRLVVIKQLYDSNNKIFKNFDKKDQDKFVLLKLEKKVVSAPEIGEEEQKGATRIIDKLELKIKYKINSNNKIFGLKIGFAQNNKILDSQVNSYVVIPVLNMVDYKGDFEKRSNLLQIEEIKCSPRIIFFKKTPVKCVFTIKNASDNLVEALVYGSATIQDNKDIPAFAKHIGFIMPQDKKFLNVKVSTDVLRIGKTSVAIKAIAKNPLSYSKKTSQENLILYFIPWYILVITSILFMFLVTKLINRK